MLFICKKRFSALPIYTFTSYCKNFKQVFFSTRINIYMFVLHNGNLIRRIQERLQNKQLNNNILDVTMYYFCDKKINSLL